MLVLFETPTGFALFKVLDEGKLSQVEDLWKDFTAPESARKVVKLKAFQKFENVPDALSSATLLVDSKPSKALRKFLRANCVGEQLAVADAKLGGIIKEKLEIECVHNSAVMELMRGVRNQLNELIAGLDVQDFSRMSCGLARSLSRYKLKFSPDKLDTMIVQAIGLLDDLDKELNTYAMRVREWYGWHFPELVKVVPDNILYAKTVKLMGNRSNAASLDFSEILPEETEANLKAVAMISMGTEVSDLDLINIKSLCEQVLSLSEYRATLYDYLKNRMNTIAPNLTALVGELVGARLIAHGGSLLNLAKQPGSTVQILGAEKALFRALKSKHATPKYGLLFHASLIGQAAPKFKGKISRSLAAKAVLAIRYDALGENQDASMGLENRAKLEARLRNLEGRELGHSAGSTKGKPKIEPYSQDRKSGAGGLLTAAKTYNPTSDSVLGKTVENENQPAGEHAEAPTKKRKHEKLKAADDSVRGPDAANLDQQDEVATPEKKKRRKHQKEESSKVEEISAPKEEEDAGKEKKKKKKKHATPEEEQAAKPVEEDGLKKKKKKKDEAAEPKQDEGEKKKKKKNRDD
ncbi:unnamed protein product [Victoria cruziana]